MSEDLHDGSVSTPNGPECRKVVASYDPACWPYPREEAAEKEWDGGTELASLRARISQAEVLRHRAVREVRVLRQRLAEVWDEVGQEQHAFRQRFAAKLRRDRKFEKRVRVLTERMFGVASFGGSVCWFYKRATKGVYPSQWQCGNWKGCFPLCPLRQLADLVGITPRDDGRVGQCEGSTP